MMKLLKEWSDQGMNNLNYVFVYGTLRKNERNHYLLKGSTLIAGQACTKGELFDTGASYPAMKESTTKMVYGELYLVSEEQLRVLDRLEGYDPERQHNLFDRKKQFIFHDSGKKMAYLYIISGENEKMLTIQIKSGDWKLYKFLKQNRSFLYFAYGSCMDDLRFKTQKVNHYFQNVKGRGILNGYNLWYTRKASDGGRADIVEIGGTVEGKVYELSQECLPYLFKREGVGSGCYRPAFIDITLEGKEIKDVLTFTVVNKEKETLPPAHYMEEIIRGANGFLSVTYISELKEHLKNI